MKQFKTFDEFKRELEINPDLQNQFKQDPLMAVKQFQQSNPLTTDVWVYRIVVASLGLTIIAIIIGVLILVGSSKITQDNHVPTILTAIGSAAIGALAGLLAPSPRNSN